MRFLSIWDFTIVALMFYFLVRFLTNIFDVSFQYKPISIRFFYYLKFFVDCDDPSVAEEDLRSVAAVHGLAGLHLSEFAAVFVHQRKSSLRTHFLLLRHTFSKSTLLCSSEAIYQFSFSAIKCGFHFHLYSCEI